MEKKKQKPYIFLSTDEEVGGSTTKIGAKDCKDLAKGINFILALDRQGSVDSVYYQCDNKEFKKWIDDHGFTEAQGTRTDICTLCDEWDVAGVNFSVGYYSNHTERETVHLDELYVTLEKCMYIICKACIYSLSHILKILFHLVPYFITASAGTAHLVVYCKLRNSLSGFLREFHKLLKCPEKRLMRHKSK